VELINPLKGFRAVAGCAAPASSELPLGRGELLKEDLVMRCFDSLHRSARTLPVDPI
jgi:hypothetical protein